MAGSSYFSFVFSSFLLFLFISLSHSSSTSTPKVALSLYYETLCPFCQGFIVNLLADAVKSDLMKIVDLQLFPWGNALLQPNNTILCQHGEDECYLNTIHACAINIWPDVMTHFALIKCTEDQPRSISPELRWQKCAEKLKFPIEPIKGCYDSGYGRKLLLEFGNKTDQLKPPHQYVPWVVVNGKPLYTDYEKFVHYVCKAYKGNPLPKACSSLPIISSKTTIDSVTPMGPAILEPTAPEGPTILVKSIESVQHSRGPAAILDNNTEPPK